MIVVGSAHFGFLSVISAPQHQSFIQTLCPARTKDDKWTIRKHRVADKRRKDQLEDQSVVGEMTL